MARAARNKDTGLTDKEEAFCHFLVNNLDATDSDALRHAYNCSRMKDATVHNKAYDLKNKPHIQAYIAQMKAERSERTKVDADYVIRRLQEMDALDPIDIMTDEGGLKPLKEWPKAWRTSISGFDVTQLVSGTDDASEAAVLLKKIKWVDKTKVLEMMGKHVTVQAWRDQLGVGNPDGSAIEARQFAAGMDPVEASRMYRELLQQGAK